MYQAVLEEKIRLIFWKIFERSSESIVGGILEDFSKKFLENFLLEFFLKKWEFLNESGLIKENYKKNRIDI